MSTPSTRLEPSAHIQQHLDSDRDESWSDVGAADGRPTATLCGFSLRRLLSW
jgi:hypothetical protein